MDFILHNYPISQERFTVRRSRAPTGMVALNNWRAIHAIN